ncbi:MAG: helix-turn-helix transcriptional regulator [Chloroflexi bacterium]|nr:helix-turn-helix transcriptional regulator [Chloroflexota bacterium]
MEHLKPNKYRLRAYRLMAGWTQLQAARKAGTTQPHIHNLEAGKYNPEMKTLHKLANAYNCDITDFFVPEDMVENLDTLADMAIENGFRSNEVAPGFKAKLGLDWKKIPRTETPNIETSTVGYDGWRNPELLPFTSDNSIKVKSRRSKCLPLVMAGPTRCGKTMLGLEDLVSLHFDNPGMRSLVVRSDAVDLKETIRKDLTYLSKYHLEDPISPISAIGRGGARNFTSLGINEGEMVLGGLNRDDRLLGTAYDVIYASQLETIDEQTFMKMLTRCAGDLGGLKDADGNQYGRLYADCNPAPDSEHWILKMAEAGKLELINFGFEDNPLYYDRRGDQTQVGGTVIGNLDTSLEGISHDLYFKGLWADIAGKLFKLDPQLHFVDEPKDLSPYIWYRGVDFGIKSPSVCVWFGIHRRTKQVYVHREFRHSKYDTIQLGNAINEHTDERVAQTVIDNDENEQMLLKKHCQIPTIMTKKSSTSVMNRVHLLQNLLERTLNGETNGIVFNRSMRCNLDPILARDKLPLSTPDELKSLYADDNDKIVGSDHGFDALTYPLLWLETEAKTPVGFGGAGARRKRRA